MTKEIGYRVKLNNNVMMPVFGLGVYKLTEPGEAEELVVKALKNGYRSIDTATYYHNEHLIGAALKNSGIKREELFITTKVWNSEQGFDSTLKSFEQSLKLLDLEYIDLYLVHWPVQSKFTETWKALEKLYKDKKVNAIGVSNFQIHHLEKLFENSQIIPAVNQIELHPYLQQNDLRNYCTEKNIAVEAWSPIAKGTVISDPVLQKIAAKHNKNPVQITLRWHIQNNTIVIPKSASQQRILSNADIFDFELEQTDMSEINNLNKNLRIGPDPDNFDF